jgi:hypothetical protein
MQKKHIAAYLADSEYDATIKCNIHFRVDGVFTFMPEYCRNPVWMKVVNRYGMFYACKECATLLVEGIQEELIKDSAIIGTVRSEEQKAIV